MKRLIPRLLIVYGTSLSVMFGVALIPDYAALIHAVERLTARGGRLVNVDVTLICERPKVKPHRQAMRERLAKLLSLPLDAVSVKATTTEAMGFTGRGEGLAAQALATIELTGA
jgi:2-C-methyl-D-erythritol 4-phosphate cytidylyltransferase/2-C-methyl-D-erythritol 2,4-cyclodiphosphate synthase